MTETSRNLNRLDKQIKSYIQRKVKEKFLDLSFEQFKNDDFFRDNPYHKMLLKEIELIVEGLAETRQEPIQQSYLPKSSGITDNVILELNIQQAQNKAKIIEEEMLAVAKQYAKQIVDLKSKLNIIKEQL